MFRWKKRDEGFEWHKYVRTTIKLRREARRRKAEDLGLQMAEGAKAAGIAADAMARSGAETGARFAKAAWSRIGSLSMSGMAGAGRWFGAASAMARRGLGPLMERLARPTVVGALLAAGLLCAAAGAGRAFLAGSGIDAQAAGALLVGCLALLLAIAAIVWRGPEALPKIVLGKVSKLPPRPVLIASAAGLGLIAVVGAVTLAGGRVGQIASFAKLPFAGSVGSTRKVSGEGRVLGADLLRVGTTTVRLEGIEAPHADQRCFRPGGRNGGRGWPCGQDAREALHRLVRGTTVTCDVEKGETSGPVPGRCRAGGSDLGEALVRSGHAFAAPGLLSTYASAETVAREAKLGIWVQTEPERPSAWRERLWSEAKQKAPDGCPIKARSRGQEKVYLLPWSADYGRMRVDPRRGDRWFCSEDEALAAGWRSPGRS
ncbi:MAG: thermonuclease family protein [Proteobacteria bacterium]|nr:thermonuclease family protein [Pseudomonadota bacterium]